MRTPEEIARAKRLLDMVVRFAKADRETSRGLFGAALGDAMKHVLLWVEGESGNGFDKLLDSLEEKEKEKARRMS